MNRFLKIANFRASALTFVSLLFFTHPVGLVFAQEARLEQSEGEYIKSMPAERTNCRQRFRAGQLDEAAEPCRAWVTLAPDIMEKSEALSVLGQLYASMGDLDEARGALDEAASYLVRSRDAAGVEKWVKTQALRARFAEGQDQMDQARLIYIRAEERVRALAGENSAAFGLAAENRAAFLARTGDMEKATELYTQAVAAYDAAYGPYNERSLESVLNLAVAQMDHDQKELAERTLLTLLGAMQLGKRETSEGAAEALTFLGNLRIEKDDVRGGVNYFRQALAVREALHGPRDLRTAQSLNSLGVANVKLGDLKRAEELLSRAYSIRVSVLGPDDSQTASSLRAVQAVIDLQKERRAAIGR